MIAAVRERVVAEAMAWLGTPYAHRQRLKGVGVDCAQLPLAVYAAAGVIGEADVGAYASQWHLHRAEELYLHHLQALGGREIAALVDPDEEDVDIGGPARATSCSGATAAPSATGPS